MPCVAEARGHEVRVRGEDACQDPDIADPKGWYQHPKGTVADRADEALMKADGIDPDAKF